MCGDFIDMEANTASTTAYILLNLFSHVRELVIQAHNQKSTHQTIKLY